MTRFLAYTTPNLGHLYPLVPILLELRARGHDVTVCTKADQCATLGGLGLTAVALDPRIEALSPKDWQEGNSIDALASVLRFAAARADLELEQLPDLMAKTRAEVLIADPASFGAFAFAQAQAPAWAVYSPFAPMMRSRDVPPYGPGLPPAQGPAGRMRDALIRQIADRAYRRALAPAQALRARLGLQPTAGIDDSWRAAPLVLLLTAEPFEYPRTDWPSNVRMIGPCLWEPPQDPPEWLDSLRDPIILVTACSQFQNDQILLNTAFAAFAEQPVSLVVATGAHDPVTLNPPRNAHVAAFLPYQHIIPRATCVITHAGMGTTQKALAAGVPVCAIPFMRDQLEVARRVKVANAGTRLSPNRLTPKRLRANVHQAIRCRPGALRIADAFARAGGPNAAADALEQLPAANHGAP
jgi:MGT family glycosyltransferase